MLCSSCDKSRENPVLFGRPAAWRLPLQWGQTGSAVLKHEINPERKCLLRPDSGSFLPQVEESHGRCPEVMSRPQVCHATIASGRVHIRSTPKAGKWGVKGEPRKHETIFCTYTRGLVAWICRYRLRADYRHRRQ